MNIYISFYKNVLTNETTRKEVHVSVNFEKQARSLHCLLDGQVVWEYYCYQVSVPVYEIDKFIKLFICNPVIFFIDSTVRIESRDLILIYKTKSIV
jgi:hypothetical protein